MLVNFESLLNQIQSVQTALQNSTAHAINTGFNHSQLAVWLLHCGVRTKWERPVPNTEKNYSKT